MTTAPVRRFAVLVAAWLLCLGLLQWSVVRFRVPIVVGLTAGLGALAWWLLRRREVTPHRGLASLALLGSGAVLLAVPQFSYLRGAGLAAATAVLAATAAAGAVLVLLDRAWAGRVAVAVAAGAYAVTTAVAVRTDPAPRIDVWVTLQQASDALARGENFYAMTWRGSPGVSDAFTYLPWSAVLLAPGRWLAGDVRWMLGAWAVVALAALGSLARDLPAARRWVPGFVTLLLAAAPGTLTQVDQAWTEPLLLAGLVLWLVLVVRGHAWWAVLPLALACASKQHLAAFLPLLLVWRPFGVRRTLATGGLTALLVAPWVVASPADFVHDTVTLLVGFHPIRFANTWYLYALNVHGVTLPFWLTGLLVLGTLAVAVVLVRRRQPDPAELLRWLALVLLAANLVNKQAFYNQYWLCAALVAVSLAAPPLSGSASRPAPATRG